MSNETVRRQPGRAIVQRLVLAVLSLVVSMVLAEIAYRLVLASDSPAGRRLRNPSLYGNPFSDDLFWLLRHRWQKQFFEPPKNPHPVLGWRIVQVGPDYSHLEEKRVGRRRPVLLYGDSFAQGMPGVDRFQKILNQDRAFARDHYLLNYAAGGYGLDQIYLMFKHSIDRFENPFVVFSVMTFDLDRSVLSVRIGQKPYFEVIDGTLELRGVPVESNPEDYFDSHPPRVGSYLWRRLDRLLRGGETHDEERNRARKKKVNGAILNAAIDELEARRLDYVILVFHARRAFIRGPGWRSSWIKSQLDERQAPYLWSYDILQREAGDLPIDDLFDPRNVHPTSLTNRIIAQAIAEEVKRASTP